MSFWQRLLYALAFVGVANAIALLTLAVAAPDTMSTILREMHWLVLVEIAITFPLVPMLARYIPRKRSSA
jgi:hypothetical protein